MEFLLTFTLVLCIMLNALQRCAAFCYTDLFVHFQTPALAVGVKIFEGITVLQP